MMPSLAALEPYQRTGYQSIIGVCRENRSKLIYFRELLRMASVRPKCFEGIVTNLRLANEYDALCELRSALILVEIENVHLDRAIEKMDLRRELQPEGPSMKDIPKFETPKQSIRPPGLNEKQLVCLAVIEALAALEPADQIEVISAAETFIRLRVQKK